MSAPAGDDGRALGHLPCVYRNVLRLRPSASLRRVNLHFILGAISLPVVGSGQGKVMKRTVLGVMAALAVSASAFALTAAAEGDQQSTRAERMQHWAADRETIVDAKLAGMKAGLDLTPDQEKLWSPFESAVKDAAKARMDAMRQMMDTHAQGERMSPDRPSRGDGRPSFARRGRHQEDRRRRQAPLRQPRRFSEAQVRHAWTHADAGAGAVRHGHDAPSHGRARRQRPSSPGARYQPR